MAKFKKLYTRTKAKNRADALTNGRSGKAAYTSGAQNAQGFGQHPTLARQKTEKEGMIDAWRNGEEVRTYTQSRSGRLSADGRTAGGSTWTFTDKDADGNKLRQSGRNKLATRRQRYYDVRRGLGLAGG